MACCMVLFLHLHGGSNEYHKPLRIATVLAHIQTRQLPTTSRKPCYLELICQVVLVVVTVGSDDNKLSAEYLKIVLNEGDFYQLSVLNRL